MEREEIPSFFIPRYNLLSVADYENRLRLCVVEVMLNRMKGLEVAYTLEDAREMKKQIRVLEMIDLLEYMISSTLGGKDLSALWNKMFVNIGNVPGSRKFGWFWNQFCDLYSTELDEEAYVRLIQIWSWVEDLFKQLIVTLHGELNLLAQKFYIRTCEKKKKSELQHKGVSERQIKQIPLREDMCKLLEDLADCYIEEENSSWANLHKAIPSGFTTSGFFQDVADITAREGSKKGLALLKQRIKQYLSMVPEDRILAVCVGYVGHIILHAKEILTRKLDYITIPDLPPELELD